MALWLWAIGFFSLVNSARSGISETREVLLLDGVWNCYCEREGDPLTLSGQRKLSGTVKMPVPGSALDFAAHMDPKSCRGIVWYERSFFVPTNWKHDRKIWLRIDGITAPTELWINRENMSKTNKSFVPIESEVTEQLVFDSENRIALAVDHRAVYQFPGIPQSVSLRTVPEMLFIQSVSLNTTVTNGTAFIRYKVIADGLLRLNRKCISVQVLEMNCTPVASDTICGGSLEGTIEIPNYRLWWPMTMDPKAGFLYNLVFKLYYKYCDSIAIDVYRQKIGIRTLTWSNNSLMVNGRRLYLLGVETNDEWIRKPFNPRTDLRDVGLIKWLNGNALAMNAVPSEDLLDLADELGLIVILGSPKCALEDVIVRYRSHPSVMLWSVLEGDDCNSTECGRYVDSLFDRWRTLDSSRPFTAIIPLSASTTPLVKKLDIVSLCLGDDAGFSSNSTAYIKKFQKGVIIMHGDKFISTNNRIRTLNYDPYSEIDEIQMRLDSLRRDVSIVGEFFGNLVAYEYFTDECFTLVDGIFNRNREPTSWADFIRSKFRERRSLYSYRKPRCKFNKRT